MNWYVLYGTASQLAHALAYVCGLSTHVCDGSRASEQNGRLDMLTRSNGAVALKGKSYNEIH